MDNAEVQLRGYRRLRTDDVPPNDTPSYRSTALRHPTQPLVIVPQTLSEITGPAHGDASIGLLDHDLTRQHAGEPIGERIVIAGRVLVPPRFHAIPAADLVLVLPIYTSVPMPICRSNLQVQICRCKLSWKLLSCSGNCTHMEPIPGKIRGKH